MFETRTAPPKEEDTSAADAAAAMGYGLGMMGSDTLMITNAPSYGKCNSFHFMFFITISGYGGGYGQSSIPDPYQQQPVYGYGGGTQPYGGYY